MITALAFLTAVTARPPQQNLSGLFTPWDYPQSALNQGEQGSVYIQVVIDPEGRVDSCGVLISSGYKDLDDVTCRVVLERARFVPLKGDHDEPIYGTYRQVISWGINGPGPQIAVIPDLDLTINQAREGVTLPLEFDVQYLVQPNGTASRCRYSPVPKPAAQMPPPVLVNLACDSLMRSSIQLVRNHKNEPVEASTSATVRFSLKP